MYKNLIVCISAIFFFAGCAAHNVTNNDFDKRLIAFVCDEEFFAKTQEKVKNGDDVIYQGLNVGLIARNCSQFKTSNALFDGAEEAYKYDVDLEGVGSKAGKAVVSTLINDTIMDYQGNLYERIMVNAYKGLNYMSLGDYEEARIEFNRALMRQDKAKEYFAKAIAKNREDYDKLQKQEQSEDSKKAMNDGVQSGEQYATEFLKEFQTTKNFINPYATYLSSVFFFMDGDYRRAADLFREVVAVTPKSQELRKERKVFDRLASRVKQGKKKYIFLIHEDGLGTIKEQFKFTIPFPVDGKIITANATFPKLVKRKEAYPNLLLNDVKTVQVSNFDNIVATEYKIEMPSMILKSVTQAIVKTGINIAVAQNDATGGFLSLGTAIFNTITTQSDERSWRGLPKTAWVVMEENKGQAKVTTTDGMVLLDKEVDKNKNVVVFIRTFKQGLPPSSFILSR